MARRGLFRAQALRQRETSHGHSARNIRAHIPLTISCDFKIEIIFKKAYKLEYYSNTCASETLARKAPCVIDRNPSNLISYAENSKLPRRIARQE